MWEVLLSIYYRLYLAIGYPGTPKYTPYIQKNTRCRKAWMAHTADEEGSAGVVPNTKRCHIIPRCLCHNWKVNHAIEGNAWMLIGYSWYGPEWLRERIRVWMRKVAILPLSPWWCQSVSENIINNNAVLCWRKHILRGYPTLWCFFLFFFFLLFMQSQVVRVMRACV